jgi:hypothetical protein
MDALDEESFGYAVYFFEKPVRPEYAARVDRSSPGSKYTRKILRMVSKSPDIETSVENNSNSFTIRSLI